jgi:hypothetical protein
VPAPESGSWTLDFESYDDAVRIRVGDVAETIAKGPTRGGRLALLAKGTVRFEELVVDGLDAFRFEFTTSRYHDFVAHFASRRGGVLPLPALTTPDSSVGELLSVLTSAVALAEPPDAIDRQQRFDEWTAALAVPLSARVDRLEISARQNDDGTELLLLESPEPLPLGVDVAFTLWQLDSDGNETEVASVPLLDGVQCRALIVPYEPNSLTPLVLAPGP